MKRDLRLKHIFLEHIPEQLEDGVLYISIRFAMVIHQCCCGCGSEVATPLSPTDWSLTFDGQSISLHPSIGNWNLPCRSHYVISKSRVHWAPRWPQWRIDKSRLREQAAKKEYYERRAAPHAAEATPEPSASETPPPNESIDQDEQQ
jgi:hypothetical protein